MGISVSKDNDIVVQKFGGTSVGTVERIAAVAKRIAKTRADGAQVIVVVSAMSGETNRLLKLGAEVAKSTVSREMDALVSTGEQVTAALLAMKLCDEGVPAQSFLGHQIRIKTDSVHSKARIQSIDGGNLKQALDAGNVAVVAGFQGVDAQGNITTLGRGGSDTTAVAIAAAVGAGVCEIYTDVDGVYTTDPNVCATAQKIDTINYEEMLELASLGAKVLQIRSVEVAMNYQVPIHVRSSFSEDQGTWVVGEKKGLEAVVVAGVAADRNENKITMRSLPDQPGTVAQVFDTLAQQNIAVDMIIQNVSEKGSTDLTFTVSNADAQQALEVAQQISASIGAADVLLDSSVAKISIVGSGMRTHAGVAASMFNILAKENINIQAISTSEIKVSCLVAQKYAELAVRALHEGFELGGRPR